MILLYTVIADPCPLSDTHLEGNFLLLWKPWCCSDHTDGTVILYATNNVDACMHCAYLFLSYSVLSYGSNEYRSIK